MEHHSANTSSDKNAIQEHKVEIAQQYFDGRRIHRVPQHLRSKSKNQNEEDYYTPTFFSLGPYHHGRSPQLSEVDSFKLHALEELLSSRKIKREITRETLDSEVSKVIDEVSKCYVGISEGENNIDDHRRKLTEIMVLDSCFFIYLMKVILGHKVRKEFEQRFGKSALSYVFQDIYLLENQIPLWVIKHVLSLIYNTEEDGSELLCRFLSKANFGDPRPERVLDKPLDKPLHFLDACRMLALSTNEEEKPEGGLTKCLKQLCRRKNGPTHETGAAAGEGQTKSLKQPRGKKKGPTQEKSEEGPTKCLEQLRGKKKLRYEFTLFNRQFRSVTDLKAKGIFFRPSSYCLKDIEFQSYGVCAVLSLPRFLFTSNSKLYFLNMVAYELSPESVSKVDIICYLNFLKSLVLKPQDVRELREKKIFSSSLDSDEQVLQVIKEIDTFGLHFTIDKLKGRIEYHCNSKLRTWIAEFVNNYLRSPWTVIALVAITLQLGLTIVQTIYAIHPAS